MINYRMDVGKRKESRISCKVCPVQLDTCRWHVWNGGDLEREHLRRIEN
jgi:hypothetical protein